MSDCFGAGFWPTGTWKWTGVTLVCSRTWQGDLLFHFLESHSGLGSPVEPRSILVRKAEGLSAVSGLTGQRYWR